MKNKNDRMLDIVREKERESYTLLKNPNGITLVALIITIAILLILAGVAINQITSENGIFKRTVKVADEAEMTSVKEEIDIAYINAKDKKDSKNESLADIMIKDLRKKDTNVAIETDGDTISIFYKGYDFEITDSDDSIISEGESKYSDKIYVKLYSYKDGTGDALVFSSQRNYAYQPENVEVELKKSYGNIINEVYNIKYISETKKSVDGKVTTTYTGWKAESKQPWLKQNETIGGTATNKTITYSVNNPDIIKVVIADNIYPRSLKNLFFGLTKATTIQGLENVSTQKLIPDSEGIIRLNGLFRNCNNIKSINLSSWDTSQVQEMYGVFAGCSNLTTLNIKDGFVTSNVTNLAEMFASCSKIVEIKTVGWDTSNVTNINRMFDNCSALNKLDVSNWGFPNLISASKAFCNCTQLYNLNLKNWNPMKIENMESMFQYSSIYYLDFSQWDTPNLSKITLAFSGMNHIGTINLSGIKTSKVTNMYGVFAYSNVKKIILNQEKWDTSKVIDMNSMFAWSVNLTENDIDLSFWNTSKLIDMREMFAGMYSITELDLNNWDVSRVRRLIGTFKHCRKLKTLIINNWDTENVAETSYMFDRL